MAMSNSKACILDHNSLGELNNAFEYAADSVLKVQKAIVDYLVGVVEVMEQQLEIVKQKYEEAKERLTAAESRLAAAEAQLESARESLRNSMDDGGEGVAAAMITVGRGVVGTVSVGAAGAMVAAARADYERARRNCEKWEKNYEIAQKVVSQCKEYKEDWNYKAPAMFVTGGDDLLESLGTYQTDEATKKLRKILEIVEKYLNIRISSHGNRIPEDIKILDKYDKRKIIRNSDAKVRKEQIDELNRHNAADANRVAKCSRCGRPLSICICGYSRNNIKLL